VSEPSSTPEPGAAGDVTAAGPVREQPQPQNASVPPSYPWVMPPAPGFPGYGYPPNPGPMPGALWPPVPPGYYERPLKPPYNERPPFRPGPVFCIVTALVLVPGLVGASGPDLGYIQSMSIGVAALIGAVWFLALVTNSQESHFRYDRRSWLRWGAPPAIFFLAMAGMSSPIPATVRFDLSEPALQQAATQTTADTGYSPTWIGLYDVYDIRVDGPVRFFDVNLPSDSSGRCSYIYAPQQNAAFDSWMNAAWNVRSLGQDWWYGCQGAFYGGD